MAVTIESRVPAEIRSVQERKFAALMRQVLQQNAFYQRRYEPLGFKTMRPVGRSDRRVLPFISREEIVNDQQAHGPFGSNLSYQLHKFTRLHRSAGTGKSKLTWLDTVDSWNWWLDCWVTAYEAAGVTNEDRILVSCSFESCIDFWAAIEAGQRLGALAISGGGMSSKQQLDALHSHEVTVMVSTPSEILRLARPKKKEACALKDSAVRTLIHAAEPPPVDPGFRKTVETAWGAQSYYVASSCELGAWGYSCGTGDRLHINEAEFIVEVVEPKSDELVLVNGDEIQRGELVLTGLGRMGSPLIRYRTGLAIELSREPCRCGREIASLLSYPRQIA